MTGFPINPPREPIAGSSGIVTNSWYRYFAQIQAAVGSAATATWQDGYLLGPGPLAALSTDLIDGGSASIAFGVRDTATDTTLQANDCLLRCDATSSPLSVVLPSAATCAGRVCHIKKVDVSANAVTIAGTDLIDGAASLSITTAQASYTLASNGMVWSVI